MIRMLRAFSYLTAAACIIALLAMAVPPAVCADWKADERMVATVELPAGELLLKDVCAELRSQITAEIYVDRRFEDRKIAVQAGPITLKTAMEAIELASGFKWRSVGDMFFLCREVQGEAVGRWYERYEQAKKVNLAGLTERRAKEWLSDEMPFPPRFDMPWNLTPLQREELAYEGFISVYTMTFPQLDWLEDALWAEGYQSGQSPSAIDRLAQVSPDLPVKLNAALAIESRGTSLLVEMPLAFSQPEPEDSGEQSPPPEEPPPSDSEEEPAPTATGAMRALRIEGGGLNQLSELLKKAGEAGVKDVFVPVFERGHLIYPSANFPQRLEYRGTDVLASIIRAAEESGITVHAVVNVTLWGDARHPVPSSANRPGALDRNLTGRTYAEQERWQRSELERLEAYGPSSLVGDESAVGESDIYLCPASSLVPILMRTLVGELASRYPTVGICLEGADYPKSTPFVLAGRNLSPPFGYTEEVRREMIRANHVDPIDIDAQFLRTEADMEASTLWDQFRRGRLTNLVRGVLSQYRSSNRTGIGSVILNLGSKSQSPSHWSRIEGLDLLMPEIEIKAKADDEGFAYDKEDAEAISALQGGILKRTALVPIITGLDAQSLPDQVLALTGLVRLAREVGLKGYAVSGDIRTLSTVLDVLADGSPTTDEGSEESSEETADPML